jgi:hypothetical protein
MSTATAGWACATTTNAAPHDKGWAKGSNVNVYIDPAITGDARDAVEDAFINWAQASNASGNGSGVTFTFAATEPEDQDNSYVVHYGDATALNNGSPTSGVTFAPGGSTGTYWARTTIDPVVTDYDAMLELVAHEIGHTFQLDDCRGCSLSESVMSASPIGTNWNSAGGRPTSPTACDNQTLKATSYPSTGGGGGSLPPGSGNAGGSSWSCTPWYELSEVSINNGVTWTIEGYTYMGCF